MINCCGINVIPKFTAVQKNFHVLKCDLQRRPTYVHWYSERRKGQANPYIEYSAFYTSTKVCSL